MLTHPSVVTPWTQCAAAVALSTPTQNACMLLSLPLQYVLESIQRHAVRNELSRRAGTAAVQRVTTFAYWHICSVF